MNTSDLWNHFKELTGEEERKRRELLEQGRLARLEQMRNRQREQILHEAIDREGERLKKEREEKSHSRELKLFNVRWQHLDQEIHKERPDSVYIGETIIFTVDHENGDNRPIEFQVKDSKIKSGIDPEKGVDEVQSKIESPSHSVQWTVLEPRSIKEANREMDLYVLAKSGEITSDICKITVLDIPGKHFILSE